jgi:hypothetical protein
MSERSTQEIIAEARVWCELGYNPPPSYKGRNGVEILSEAADRLEAQEKEIAASVMVENDNIRLHIRLHNENALLRDAIKKAGDFNVREMLEAAFAAALASAREKETT